MREPSIKIAIDDINKIIRFADEGFRRFGASGYSNEWETENIEWFIESAFIRLALLAETLHLPLFREQILTTFHEAKIAGLASVEVDIDGEPSARWGSKLRQFVLAISSIYGLDDTKTVTKEIESILRACTYSITDKQVFPVAPKDENEVHRRIEAVLRCVFPDLLHKPRLSKPIKNFEPDTGLPSIRTLIEYKFLSKPEQCGPMADEVLADTRGYASKDWDTFIYVIYETQRIRPEVEWKQLLLACDLSSNTHIVVLSGEPSFPNGTGNFSVRKSSRDGKNAINNLT